MRFIKIVEEDVNLVNKEITLEYLREKYNDLFTGLGCFPGEYDISIDDKI